MFVFNRSLQKFKKLTRDSDKAMDNKRPLITSLFFWAQEPKI